MPTCRTAKLSWRFPSSEEGGERLGSRGEWGVVRFARGAIIGQICTSFSLAEPEIEIERSCRMHIMLSRQNNGCRFLAQTNLDGRNSLKNTAESLRSYRIRAFRYLRFATEYIMETGPPRTSHVYMLHDCL